MDRFSSVLLISFSTLLVGSSIGWSQTDSANETPQFQELPVGAASDQAPSAAPAAVETPVPTPVSAPVTAAIPVAKPAAMPHKNYKVRIWQTNGECLWRISEKVYGDRSKWRLIYLSNKDIIHDPNKIYPNQQLKIPPPDWQP